MYSQGSYNKREARKSREGVGDVRPEPRGRSARGHRKLEKTRKLLLS